MGAGPGGWVLIVSNSASGHGASASESPPESVPFGKHPGRFSRRRDARTRFCNQKSLLIVDKALVLSKYIRNSKSLAVGDSFTDSLGTSLGI